MRITYQLDGTPVPRYEAGDMVRLVRDEPGPLVTAHAGDWGEVLRNNGAGGLDIRLAGYPARATRPSRSRPACRRATSRPATAPACGCACNATLPAGPS